VDTPFDDERGTGLQTRGVSGGALDRIRLSGTPDHGEQPTIEQVNQELCLRAEPGQVTAPHRFELPWSPEAKARTRARTIALEARLDGFRDTLRAIRAAREALNRAATVRAFEAAERAILEIRAAGEAGRLAIVNRTHLQMTAQFLEQIEALEQFKGRTSPEILDALKERALNEFTTRMNRASKSDVELASGGLLRVKP